jgi:hypothetical protein
VFYDVAPFIRAYLFDQGKFEKHNKDEEIKIGENDFVYVLAGSVEVVCEQFMTNQNPPNEPPKCTSKFFTRRK